MDKSTRKGQSEVQSLKTQESGVPKRNICVGQLESHAGKVGEAMQNEHGQVRLEEMMKVVMEMVCSSACPLHGQLCQPTP